MRLRERIGSAWHALTSKSAPPAGSYSYGWGGGSSWSDAFRFRRAPSPAELVESYKSIVYACVNLNANAVARAPLRLFAATKSGQARPRCAVRGISKGAKQRLGRLDYVTKTIAGALEVEEVTDHPLLDAVMKVNEDLDHTQLITYTAMSLDIVGSAYWWPSLSRFGTPEELWALPPHLVFPVFTSGTMVPDAYSFGGVMYDKRDLVRFRRLSAKNPYGQGYGPEQAAIEYARLEDTFVSIQDNLLSNGPRPSLIVSHKDPKGSFGSAERQRLEADMERRGRGGRAGGVFVVDGAAAVTPISYTPTDLGGLQVSSYDLERIANCFDVPVSMLKTDDVNRANAEAGLEQHGRNAVEPRCRAIASTLTRWTHSLDPKGHRGWDRLFWAFDPVVAEDKRAESELHKTYLDLGVLTRNEVRLDIGYAPADGGDALLVPKGLARLSDFVADPVSSAKAGLTDDESSETHDDDPGFDPPGAKATKPAPPPRPSGIAPRISPERFATRRVFDLRAILARRIEKRNDCRGPDGRYAPCGHLIPPSPTGHPEAPAKPQKPRKPRGSPADHPHGAHPTHSEEAHASGTPKKSKHAGLSVGKPEQDHARDQEKHLAKVIGGHWLEDNEAADVIVKAVGGHEHACEVKTLMKGKKQAITMHPDAQLRKVEFQSEAEGRVFHTIVFDHRDRYDNGAYSSRFSGHEIYYRRAAGPYSLASMHKAKDLDELKSLIATPDHELPMQARGTMPEGEALAKLRGQAARATAYLKDRDQRRAKKERPSKRLTARRRLGRGPRPTFLRGIFRP